MFKNQSKEYLLYENRLLYNRLGKAITVMNGSIQRFKSITTYESERNSSTLRNSSVFEDEEIDKKIEKNMEKSKQLQERIYKEKK